MKKLLQIILVIVLFIISILIFWYGLSPKTFSRYIYDIQPRPSELILSNKGKIIIAGNTWNVEVVSTAVEKENGLSNRRSIGVRDGMLFVFNKADYRNFWMKDMLISLDIIFIDENWKIVLIEKNLSAETFPKTFGGGVKSKYVLEINAGEADSYGLKLGDQVFFRNR